MNRAATTFRIPLRALLGGFVGTLVAVLLAGCGGGDDSPAPASPTTAAAGGSGAMAASCTGPGISRIPRDNVRQFSAYPEMVIDPARTYTALVKTSKGDITLSLAAAQAPRTVNSFVFLSCHGFYDGLTFHRVVPNFVIQGGDPRGNGTGGPGYTFGLEISELRHDTPGTLAMARAQDPNSNGSQWYITTAVNANTANLDGQYTVFGKVMAGMDVVLAIAVGDRIESISIREQ